MANRYAGFTLIELMITVAVIAILASVALPAYSDYILRGKVAAGTQLLAEQKVRMEQYFAANRTYSGAPACTARRTEDNSFVIEGKKLDGTGDCTASTFTLRAASTDGKFLYTIDQQGTKQSKITQAGWAVSGTAGTGCWVVKRGQKCN
ncbi:type IV pilin protein [Uliginosibacterium sp. sgz301328]|uniref:type IV pilin protein n=1 Tax=Uliginosibacterium sp. sgz301328 TaxID=3243764 RepID=UPI00359EC6E6